MKSVKIDNTNIPQPSSYLNDYFWQDLHFNLSRNFSQPVADFIIANKRQEISDMINSVVAKSSVRIDLK